MKVLVADKFEESGLAGLKALGCEVLYEPKLEGSRSGRAARRDRGRGARRPVDESRRRRRWKTPPASP